METFDESIDRIAMTSANALNTGIPVQAVPGVIEPMEVDSDIDVGIPRSSDFTDGTNMRLTTDLEVSTRPIILTRRSKIEYATRDDWEKRRQIISDLYSLKKLKEVMEIMEDFYNFKARQV